MNVLDLAMNYGLNPKKYGNKHGGEFGSACPFCGGGNDSRKPSDRFRIWVDQNEGRGMYWCRQCDKHGDNIQFVMETENIGFRDAAKKAGEEAKINQNEPKSTFFHEFSKPLQDTSAFAPKNPEPPSDIWAEKAGKLVSWASGKLVGSSGADHLMSRGLSEKTIEKLSLGWISEDIYRTRESWGLETVTKPDGKSKKLWVPAGIVIPLIIDGRVERLRIRRESGEPRYFIMPGSSTRQMIMGESRRAVMIVESELDAILIHQFAGDIVCVISLGNAQSKPDMFANTVIRGAAVVLVSLDFDEAGKKSKDWWKREYPKSIRWPVPIGKDPSDAFCERVNIREWVIAGLPSGMRLTKPQAEQTLKKPEPCDPDHQISEKPSESPAENQAPEFLSELHDLMKKNLRIMITVTDRRLSIQAPEDWRKRHEEHFNRISRIVFFDSAVFNYLHEHGSSSIDSRNLLQSRG